MAAVAGNNSVDFYDLFRYNYRPLCLYALHYLGYADIAEDIVQDSYTALSEYYKVSFASTDLDIITINWTFL